MKFHFYKQYDKMDCGPTCIRMIAKYYGKEYSLDYIRKISNITREGISLLDIAHTAEKLGFYTVSSKIGFDELDDDTRLPCIIHWKQNHFVIVPPQNYDRDKNNKILIADPAHGLIKVSKEIFLKNWLGSNSEGIVIMLEPTDAFFDQAEEIRKKKKSFTFFLKYFAAYKGFVLQIALSMLFASGVSLMFPYLTQNLVDKGINQHNISLVSLILISQLLLFVGSVAIELIRSWILLHLNSRINLTILSDFLIKLMKLPIRFFENKMIGDIQQRMGDHSRIQGFLTGTTLNTIFSIVNMFVFMIVLSMYSIKILCIYLFFSILSAIWILFFMRRRKELDYERFHNASEHQNVLYEIITGMQDIKLTGCEAEKRWNWERIQAGIYKVSMKSLALNQYQQSGFSFLNQLKNILISFISAYEVIYGNMTLGMMMSVSYIIGQLSSPVGQLLSFVQSIQDAKISLDRISEIHTQEDEEQDYHIVPPIYDTDGSSTSDNIELNNVSFRYSGPNSPLVLNNVSLAIPRGKVTAIVGDSGSGKTTLLKLLLKFYDPTVGSINIGSYNLSSISPSWWRTQCGSVMQEGLIFSDTIGKNIAIVDDADIDKLQFAARVANIQEFIDDLPLGFNTKIGNSGNGISTGQKQRILIARAVYKNPQYLFFDEATSALDGNNEKIIINNLHNIFQGKTVVVIAHRLSTVKNADKIVVLNKGVIVEEGSHTELSSSKGNYYNLVKNQLELQ